MFLDDRFILKQMPRLELQSFMDLAPSYIQYLNKAFLEQVFLFFKFFKPFLCVCVCVGGGGDFHNKRKNIL